MVIGSTGNVGIASAIPEQRLTVAGTILTRSTSNTATFSYNTLRFQTSGGAHIDHGTTNQNLNFRVSKSSAADTTMVQINPASEQTKFRKYVTVGLQGGADTAQLGGGSGVGAYLQLNYASGGIVNTKLLGNGNSWLNSHYGNLGIGTQTAEQQLTVVGVTDIKHYSNTTINNDRLQLGFNAPEGYIKSKNSTGSPASNLAFYTTDTSGNTNKTMHLRYDGKVGIGIDNPSYKTQLSVSDTTAYSASTISANQFQLAITNSGAAGVAGILLSTEPSSGNGGHCGIRALSTGNGNSALTFSTRGSSASAERLRIASDGVATFSATNINVNRNAGDAFIALQTSGTSNVALYGGASSGFRVFTKPSGGSLTERLRITSGGDAELRNTVSSITNAYSSYLKFRTTQSNGQSAITGAIRAQGKSNWGGDLVLYSKPANGTPNDSVTERLRIASSGRIRLGGDVAGTTVSDLDVTRGNSTITDVMLVKGNVGNGFIRFQDNDNSCNFTFGADDGSGLGANAFILYDRNNSAYRWSVDNSGNMKVWDGNIQLASGHGIDFSATSDASGMSSELLDDYEEGSWTPSLNNAGTINYSHQIGRYTKIGRQVHFVAYVRWNSRSNNGSYNITYSGLPYNNANVGYLNPAIYVGGIAVSYTHLRAHETS